MRRVKRVRGLMLRPRGEGWGGVKGWRGSGDAESDEAVKLVPVDQMSSSKKT